MHGTKQAIAIGLVALSTVINAFAQDRPRRGTRAANSIEAAFEFLGLTVEQINKIQEIRSESPARGQSWDEIDAWRESKLERLQDVLSADQKAKLDELGAPGKRLLAVMSAGAKGLSRPRRPARATGSGRGAAGRGSNQRRGGTSRGQPGGGGGGSGRRPGSTSQDRGAGAGNRD